MLFLVVLVFSFDCSMAWLIDRLTDFFDIPLPSFHFQSKLLMTWFYWNDSIKTFVKNGIGLCTDAHHKHRWSKKGRHKSLPLLLSGFCGCNNKKVPTNPIILKNSNNKQFNNKYEIKWEKKPELKSKEILSLIFQSLNAYLFGISGDDSIMLDESFLFRFASLLETTIFIEISKIVHFDLVFYFKFNKKTLKNL